MRREDGGIGARGTGRVFDRDQCGGGVTRVRSFMHMKLGGFLHGEETIDAFRDGDSAGEARPDWGRTEEMHRKVREEMADVRYQMGKVLGE